MRALLTWVKAHRRIVVLKAVIGAMLVITHYYPGEHTLWVNLLWLIAF